MLSRADRLFFNRVKIISTNGIVEAPPSEKEELNLKYEYGRMTDVAKGLALQAVLTHFGVPYCENKWCRHYNAAT